MCPLAAEFAGDLEEGSLLCLVRAFNVYLRRTSSFVVRASSLFVSPRSSSHPISKNVVSYFLMEVISGAGAVRQDMAASLRAHSVRGVATCFFPAELVDLQGAGGCNLAIEFSVRVFLFLRHYFCFSRTAVSWSVCRSVQYC